jgi:hypothetical protein
MDDPRDDIDLWLSERVTPLLPHPGTFERIKKRARRRKLGQAAAAAGGAAVIVAAAVTIPRFITSPVTPTGVQSSVGPGQGTPAPARTHPAKPTASPSTSPSPSASSPVPPAVPANFAPSSVTFVSTRTGWVIGQAGTPGQCGDPSPGGCTFLAATATGGSTWEGLTAPPAGFPDGGYGVSQVRSLDGANGWVFGPQLYATHDGGQSWVKIPTHGMRVTDLETVNGRAFAVWAHCTGTGLGFAANCTRFSLYSTPARTDQWAPVPGVTNLTSRLVPGSGIVAASAQLALTLTVGYLLAPNGSLYSGQIGSATGWHRVTEKGGGSAGCGEPGPAQADGVPGDSMLATTGTGLVEMCVAQAPGRPQGKYLVYSGDGGRSWVPAGYAPKPGLAMSLAGTPGGQVVVATSAGIDVSLNVAGARPSGLRWRTFRGAGSAPGGFSYVGMTTSAQGVAIPAEQSLHALWFTYDGGKHWQETALP